jgi:DNA-binding transcriptional LysR family regulator
MTTTFSSFDLNLLRVFDAIMEERSVLRASQKVFLSQSAVSHSLARLRELLDDKLFVRTTTGMQPTARAAAMAPLVRDALKSLETAIDSPKFEPASSSKRFTIAANDFTTMVIAPHLLQILNTEAPSIDLAIKPVTRIDLGEQLDLGRIDLAIGTFSALPDRFRAQALFEYDDVLIASSALKLGPSPWMHFRGSPSWWCRSAAIRRGQSTASFRSADWPGDRRCTTARRSKRPSPNRPDSSDRRHAPAFPCAARFPAGCDACRDRAAPARGILCEVIVHPGA